MIFYIGFKRGKVSTLSYLAYTGVLFHERSTIKILLRPHIPLVENLAELGNLSSTGVAVYMLSMKIKDAMEALIRAFAVLGAINGHNRSNQRRN